MTAMPNATRRGNETRSRMIEAAFLLFRRHGTHAISVDDVLKESGTGKSQFYYYFQNKEGLIHAVLSRFYEALRTNQALVKTKIESWDDLQKWFEFFVEYQRRHGCEISCPVGTIGNDVDSKSDLLRQDVRMILDFVNRPLIDFFNVMKGKGEIPANADAAALADFCLCIMEGGLLVGKIRRESQPFQNSVQLAMNYLKGLRPKRERLRMRSAKR